jgi:hypothetical protein
MIADDLIKALKQLKLEIDCFEMALVQNLPENPVSYRGKGYIRQTENDTLTFKLYASETKNIDATKYMRACSTFRQIIHRERILYPNRANERRNSLGSRTNLARL